MLPLQSIHQEVEGSESKVHLVAVRAGEVSLAIHAGVRNDLGSLKRTGGEQCRDVDARRVLFHSIQASLWHRSRSSLYLVQLSITLQTVQTLIGAPRPALRDWRNGPFYGRINLGVKYVDGSGSVTTAARRK